MDRIILHIDVNNAFLSWTAIDLLRHGYSIDIRTIPSVIGGDRKSRKGIVLAKSIPAKKYGINTPEPIYFALKKCPNLKVYPPNYKWYQYMSNKLFTYLKTFTDEIEIFSIDECFLDYTSIKHIYGDEKEFAQMISNYIKTNLKFTVNIGIANNKLCAKMASDFSKPDKIHTLYNYEVKTKMWPLKVDDLLWIGKKTSEKLHQLKIDTIGDLASADVYFLTKYFKNNAVRMIESANGIDESKVDNLERIEKGISNEITVIDDLIDKKDIYDALSSVVDKTSLRLRKQNRYTSCVAIILKDKNFKRISHQKKLKNPTNNTEEIKRIVKELLNEMGDLQPIRLVGVRLDNLTDNLYRQFSMFDDQKEIEKNDKLQKVLDDIKEKYGQDLKIKKD